MRWGLVPRWWSKTLKDVKMATFNEPHRKGSNQCPSGWIEGVPMPITNTRTYRCSPFPGSAALDHHGCRKLQIFAGSKEFRGA